MAAGNLLSFRLDGAVLYPFSGQSINAHVLPIERRG